MNNYKKDFREYVVAIYETVRDELRDWWNFARDAWILILLLVIAVGVVIWLAKPAPPGAIQMGTGSAGGSNEALTKLYAEFFKKNGVTLELVPTLGAEDNIKRLKDSKDPIQAAFIQGGLISTPEQAKGLKSLGSVGYEPFWIFYRKDLITREQLTELSFLKEQIAVGQPGTGTYQQVILILKLNNIELTDNFKTLSNADAVEAFKKGTVNAVIMVEGMESPSVQAMLAEPRVGLAGFKRTDAFVRKQPAFHVLSIPEGSLDLSRDLPSVDIRTIAPTTNLVIDPNMHPAIQLLFLQAADKIHGGRSFFASYGEFPNFKESIIEESDVAKIFYKNGPPRMLEYMPFWIAEFLDRMLILLLPLGAFAYPIFKAMPSFRTNRARKQIVKVYASLKVFEQALIDHFDPAQIDSYRMTIDALDHDAKNLNVPSSLVSDYFSLRNTIDFVRGLIERAAQKKET